MFTTKTNTAKQQCNIWNTRYAGKEAFLTRDSNGYCIASIGNRKYRAHRVVWAMVNGRWPKLVDHINQVKHDNRIANLREVTKSQNSMNSRVRSDNTSGFRGVTRHQKGWMAQSSSNGRHIYIGLFPTPEDAHMAYLEFRSTVD